MAVYTESLWHFYKTASMYRLPDPYQNDTLKLLYCRDYIPQVCVRRPPATAIIRVFR